MPFVEPMLASPFPKNGFNPKSGLWFAEEKIDGYRIIIEVLRDVPSDLLTPYTVRVWSRYAISQILPSHLRAQLGRLPTGLYDGEAFVPGLRSYGARTIANGPNLQVVVFDVLRINGDNLMDVEYQHRRIVLKTIFDHPELADLTHISLAESREIITTADWESFRDEVYARDGEGLIIKNGHSFYLPKKRNAKWWFKVKQLKSALLTVTGFTPSAGEIVDRGPYACINLIDDEGNRTVVKTRNDHWLAKLAAMAGAGLVGQHPMIGRKLWIEYQERTPDGSYRHPRADRWDEEDWA